MTEKQLELVEIGVVHSPYKSTAEAPRQGNNTICSIEIFKEYEEALTDIEEFTHMHIYYYLHLSKGFNLMVQTPWDIKKHGLFTTRSPHRPNPIGHSVVELVERKNNILKVKNLDAIEGTPVIDIKPYIKSIDCKSKAYCGWTERTNLMKD